MLAAAAGDALGWPQEVNARKVKISANLDPSFGFSAWLRREGGRFASHTVEIGAGEYSDDTQLILALTRSFEAGDAWWDKWTSVDLPFWLLYERGGGSATKRAARSWRVGSPPWGGKDSRAYFDAGGNGTAMRVLPHCIRGASDDGFEPIATAVVNDGVATHGHPEAHVGALAYAFALWRAFRSNGSLKYGELISETLASVGTWSQFPGGLPSDWLHAADGQFQGGYSDLWQSTVNRMVNLLAVSESAINQGALSIDRETLAKLGAFEKRIQGAGTVTAGGAIFLASRYASRPAQGIVAAAFCHGTDSDTLASMTGGLLGAVNGADWLSPVKAHVQDCDHLKSAALGLFSRDSGKLACDFVNGDLKEFSAKLFRCIRGDQIALPDGRKAVVDHIRDLPTKTKNEIQCFVVKTDDGQTLFFKRRRRINRPLVQRKRDSELRRVTDTEQVDSGPPIAFAIETADIAASTRFYSELIGLRIVRQTDEQVVFVRGIVLVQKRLSPGSNARQLSFESKDSSSCVAKVIVFVDRARFEAVRKRMVAVNQWVSPISNVGDQEKFDCFDPNGTAIEIRDSSRGRI